MSRSNPSPIDLLHQISIEVKQGNPLVLPSEEIDTALLDKLFPNKKRPAPVPTIHGSYKKAKRNQEGPIDTKLMATLGFGLPTKTDLIIDEEPSSSTSSTCTPSPPGTNNFINGRAKPYNIPQLRSPQEARKDMTVRDALANVMNGPDLIIDDLAQLRREALEAMIARDRAMARYYNKKSKQLDRNVPTRNIE